MNLNYHEQVVITIILTLKSIISSPSARFSKYATISPRIKIITTTICRNNGTPNRKNSHSLSPKITFLMSTFSRTKFLRISGGKRKK